MNKHAKKKMINLYMLVMNSPKENSGETRFTKNTEKKINYIGINLSERSVQYNLYNTEGTNQQQCFLALLGRIHVTNISISLKRSGVPMQSP